MYIYIYIYIYICVCIYIYIVLWVICKPQSFRISIAWASLTSAVAFWNCGSIMCLGLGIRVGSTDQSHRFIMIYIYIYIYIAWIGCYRIIDIWNSGTSICWYDPISEYVGWFWSSANEWCAAWPKRRKTLGGNDFLIFLCAYSILLSKPRGWWPGFWMVSPSFYASFFFQTKSLLTDTPMY